MTLEEKRKALAKVKKEVAKKLGEGMIISGNDIDDQEFYSTGIPSIDNILGGGFAKGKLISIYGAPSSGKSTLTLQTIAYNQKIDPEFMALYVDQENAGFTKAYAKSLGVDLDRFDYMPADKAEKTTTAIRELLDSGVYNIVILDSTNALVPEGEMEKDVSATGNTMAEVARLLSKWCKQVCLQIAKPKTSIICIEQTRLDIGKRQMPGMPPAVVVGCGQAVGFYCSQRLELTKGAPVKDGDQQVGRYVKCKGIKNKVALPNVKGQTILIDGEGFNPERDAEEFLKQMFEAQADPAFVQVTKIKWEFRNPNGNVVEIKGKNNILQALKESNNFDDALAIAKACAQKQGKSNKAGSEEFSTSVDLTADAQEGVKDFNTDEEEPDV